MKNFDAFAPAFTNRFSSHFISFTRFVLLICEPKLAVMFRKMYQKKFNDSRNKKYF